MSMWGQRGDGLRIRWNARKHFYIENLFETECGEARSVMQQYHIGIKVSNLLPEMLINRVPFSALIEIGFLTKLFGQFCYLDL